MKTIKLLSKAVSRLTVPTLYAVVSKRMAQKKMCKIPDRKNRRSYSPVFTTYVPKCNGV